MFHEKRICSKNKVMINLFPKFRFEFFYPKVNIELSNGKSLGFYGKPFLNKYKCLTTYFFGNSILFRYYFHLGSFRFLPSLINKTVQLSIFDNRLENKEELREFLMTVNKNHFTKSQKNLKGNKHSILIIFSNQTSFIQLIRAFFCFKRKKYLFNKNHKNFEYIESKTWIRLKYGKIIMPADNRNCFYDGNKDQLMIYGIITNKAIKISKNPLNSNVFFATSLALKKKAKKFGKFFNNINFCWIDSLEIILMQNIENLLFIIKNLIEMRLEINYNRNGFLKKKKIDNLIFLKIYILSSLIPTFLLNLLCSLSFSNIYYLKILKKPKTLGIIICPKNYFLEKNFNTSKYKKSVLLQFLKIKMKTILKSKKCFSLLIFAKEYSDLIPIRNILHHLKKKINLKIEVFNEFLKNFKKQSIDVYLEKNINIIALMTERFFFFKRNLAVKFDLVYFQTYPNNRELYYEILKQVNT